MSPLGMEIQKDDPSTNVTAPAPIDPAAVSAFQPAIPAPFRNLRLQYLAQCLQVLMPLTFFSRRYACFLSHASPRVDT